jgi:GR25 family glycosyltransferase involved in LPS biosynthesis
MDQCRVFVMNLERRPDRLSTFKKEMPEMVRPFCLFESFDGRKLGSHYKDSKEITLLKQVFSDKILFRRGELGCWLSHLAIWFVAAEQTDHWTVIFEDDNLF